MARLDSTDRKWALVAPLLPTSRAVLPEWMIDVF
jgi:hypothetical protein